MVLELLGALLHTHSHHHIVFLVVCVYDWLLFGVLQSRRVGESWSLKFQNHLCFYKIHHYEFISKVILQILSCFYFCNCKIHWHRFRLKAISQDLVKLNPCLIWFLLHWLLLLSYGKSESYKWSLNETLGVLISSPILNGKNYHVWSQSHDVGSKSEEHTSVCWWENLEDRSRLCIALGLG